MLLYVLLLANVVAIFFSLAAHFCFQFNLFQCLILLIEMLLAVSHLLSMRTLLIPGSKATAGECLEALASGLYSELFTILISLINRSVLLIPVLKLRCVELEIFGCTFI